MAPENQWLRSDAQIMTGASLYPLFFMTNLQEQV